MRMAWTGLLVPLLLGGAVLAQQSASYRLEEFTLNSGGHPAGGVILSSGSYRVTLDAIGDAVVARGLVGASYEMDVSLATAYRPPGEVTGLSFVDAQTLRWSAEPSAGTYNLYRGSQDSLPALAYGSCERQGLVATTATDAEVPAGAFFYLVTVENRIAEEGTKGFRTGDIERTGTVCP